MNALRTWVQRPRTFRSRLARLLAFRATVFAAVAAAVLVGQAVSVTPSAAEVVPPVDTPSWTTTQALAHPECVDAADWPAGQVPSAIVGKAPGDAAAHRYAFNVAWERNSNRSEADDIYVIGICR